MQEPLEVGNEDAAIAREAAPITLMDRVLSFLAGERAEVRAAAIKEAADVASPSPNLAGGTAWALISQTQVKNQESIASCLRHHVTILLQKQPFTCSPHALQPPIAVSISCRRGDG